MLGAPDVQEQLSKAQHRAAMFVDDLLVGDAAARRRAEELAIEPSSPREDIAALATGRLEGKWHAGAVRSTTTALIEVLLHARLYDGLDRWGTPATVVVPFCNEKTSEVSFLTIIYIPYSIEPSNLQSYDPQLYILYSFLYTPGVVVLAVALAAI